MGTARIWHRGLVLFLFFSNSYSAELCEVPVGASLPRYFLWKKGRPGFEGITCGRYNNDLPTSGRPYERLFSPFKEIFSLNDKQYAVMFEQFEVRLYKVFTEGEDELSTIHFAEAIKFSGSSWVKFYAQDTSTLTIKYRGLADLLPCCAVSFHTAVLVQAFERLSSTSS